MLNGRCPRCNSQTVYKKENGVVTSAGKNIYVRGTSTFGSPQTDRMTLVCTTCGHYEDFITDKSILSKIAQKWDKV
jgi:ribosomal protein L33